MFQNTQITIASFDCPDAYFKFIEEIKQFDLHFRRMLMIEK